MRLKNFYILLPLLLLGLLAAGIFAIFYAPKAPVAGGNKACYQQFGITLSGAEGVGSDYSRPTVDELHYYASKGVKFIRLEVRWDKLQPELNGSLAEDEVKWVETFVAQANSASMQVDIDLHERSQYDDLNFGDGGLDPGSLVDFWGKFASRLVQDRVPGICGFGIANEPDQDAQFFNRWPYQANTVITAINAVDKNHFIFVGEDNWDPSKNWQPDQAKLIKNIPQVVFEAHSYWDEGGSGNYRPNNPPSTNISAERLVSANLGPFITWCQRTNSRCFVGELGVPSNDTWLHALDYALSYLKRSSIFGVYWAGGPGYDDTLSIEPVNGQDKKQMQVLEKYIGQG